MAGAFANLENVPVARFVGTLVRAVASRQLHTPGNKPDFLLTSGKANRFNVGGMRCLYMSEGEPTALAEYKRQFRGLGHGTKQPVTLYYGRVQLARILDLTDPAARRTLGVTLEELEADWGAGMAATTSQLLGESAMKGVLPKCKSGKKRFRIDERWP